MGQKIFRKAHAWLLRQEMTYIWKPMPLDQIPKETIDKVVAALENSKYDWRTIDGIISETDLSFNDVFAVLTKLNEEGKLVQARNPDEGGRDLFTTRQYYNKTRSLIDKIRSSLVDGPV
jgi:predicted Rossmann fold nucleotide-binding protein DprA/Smf involved in DNA uptake